MHRRRIAGDTDTTIADVRVERQIITGLITSKQFIVEVMPVFRSEAMKLSFAKRVASWVFEYYKNFNDAPNKNIQGVYQQKLGEVRDQAEQWLIEEFLASISNEYEQGGLNVGYLVKGAETYFRRRAIEEVQAKVNKCLIRGDVEGGEEAISSFKRVAVPSSIGLDPFRDRQLIREKFSDTGVIRDELFRYPGDLGQMLGMFERGYFGLIVGAEKRGKTFWLIDFGLRALFKGFNVLFISFEMTDKKMWLRMAQWYMGLPLERWAGDILIPIFDCKKNMDSSCTYQSRVNRVTLIRGGKQLQFDEAQKLGYTPCVYCFKNRREEFIPTVWQKKRVLKALTIDDALRKAEEIEQSILRGRRFKLLCLPAKSLNIEGLKAYLNNWEYYEGWMPDVIITDYADKMLPDKNYKEYRHNIYDIILSHKALAGERNILVMSASQSNTGRDEERDIGSGDYAEDIRKRAEIDIGWSLNQNAQEKAVGLMRVKTMAVRHDYSNAANQCYVLQQLKIGRPILNSCFIRKF
uniref:Putative helicase n=1 Tax=viral metagenome TaxID=1070528 RepID=A0A6M3KZ62_9ZZZZ